MADTSKLALIFHSHGDSDDTLMITSVKGDESISDVFHFVLHLTSRKSSLDPAKLIDANAWLGFRQGVELKGMTGGRGVRLHKIHGVLQSFEFAGGNDNDGWHYQAVLVPRLSRLALSKQSRIFQGKSVPEIVEQVMKDAGMTSDDYRMSCTGTYAPNEYIVQYQESDLHFIHRLCENAGIFYCFEHDDAGSKAVFADNSTSLGMIKGESKMRYRPGERAGSSDWLTTEEAITVFSSRRAAIPGKVVTKDYNYRNPTDGLKGERQTTDQAAYGTHYEYGQHHKDADAGAAYALVRAQEIAATAVVCSGSSDARTFRSGAVFTLGDHPDAKQNHDFLLTAVVHQATQEIRFAKDAVCAYSNEFTAIPADVRYRPPRTTPKPRIVGSMNATIDAAGSGEYAEIDDQGRYKVILPFDLSGTKDGKASRWIRMAQPYTGKDHGFHFPLHKGAEVLLIHIDGDPDRPIIVAAVPNPDTPSPVIAGNHTQALIKTAGNNELRFEDLKGSEKIFMHAERDRQTDVGNNESKTIAVDQTLSVGGNRTETIGGDHTEDIGGLQSLTVGAASTETIGAAKALTIGAAYQVTVGSAMNETVGAAKSEQVGGVSKETVVRDKSVSVGGDLTETVRGSRHESTTKEHVAKAKTITLEAEEQITLKVGEAIFILKKDGTIMVKGKDIGLAASGKFNAKSDSDMVLKGSKIGQNG